MSSRRAPSREFFNKNDKIEKVERLPFPNYRYTKYFWLINTNQAVFSKAQAEYLSQLLAEAIIEVLSDGGVVAFAHPNHKWDRRYVGSNELQIHIEIGPRKGRVHAHVIQEVKHRSTINIDSADVQQAINDVMSARTGGRVEKSFVGRKIIYSQEPLREYVEKDEHDWSQDPNKPKYSKTWNYSLVLTPQDAWIEETVIRREPARMARGAVGSDLPTGSSYRGTSEVPASRGPTYELPADIDIPYLASSSSSSSSYSPPRGASSTGGNSRRGKRRDR